MANHLTEPNNIQYVQHHTHRNPYLTFIANFRLICEMSTSFGNIRWVLAVCARKEERLYKINGAIYTLTFFLGRILPIPFFYSMVWELIQQESYIASVNFAVHVTWISVCVMLDILNIIWFRQMIRHKCRSVFDINHSRMFA
jgi:hypothetical protein